jgi:hypothetical protein
MRKRRQTFRACVACTECQIPQGYVRQEPGAGLVINETFTKGSELRNISGSLAYNVTYA